MTPIEKVKAWFARDLSRWAKPEDHIYDVNADQIRIYTDNNCYAVHATKDYLGCIASNRKTRAGEDWHRGSDLPDGPLTEETWHRIICGIVSYELVKVHKNSPVESVGVTLDGPPVGR